MMAMDEEGHHQQLQLEESVGLGQEQIVITGNGSHFLLQLQNSNAGDIANDHRASVATEPVQPVSVNVGLVGTVTFDEDSGDRDGDVEHQLQQPGTSGRHVEPVTIAGSGVAAEVSPTFSSESAESSSSVSVLETMKQQQNQIRRRKQCVNCGLSMGGLIFVLLLSLAFIQVYPIWLCPCRIGHNRSTSHNNYDHIHDSSDSSDDNAKSGRRRWLFYLNHVGGSN